MEFISYIKNIKDFIEANLPVYLDEMEQKYPAVEVTDPSRYVDDYFDTDKYKDPIVLYITPDAEYTFEELSNESKAMNNNLDVFVTFKGSSESKLEELAKVYLEAIYLMVKENPTLGNEVDYSMVSAIRYYEGVEGSTKSKAIYVRIQILKEV